MVTGRRQKVKSAYGNGRRSPDGVVFLHHPEALGEPEAAEGAGEAAEAVAVAGAEEEVIVVASVGGLGGELEPVAVREVDRGGPVEADGRRLGGNPLDPDPALAVLGRVVDSLDQVPAKPLSLGRAANPRRPAPARVPLVIARRLVVDAVSGDPPAPPRDGRPEIGNLMECFSF